MSRQIRLNIKHLQRFCNRRNRKQEKPWSKGQYTYATDGCILIRVPRIAKVTFERGENTKGLFEKHFASTAKKIIAFPAYVVSQRNCRACKGNTKNTWECEVCEGERTIVNATPIDCGVVVLNAKLLEKLKPLGVTQFEMTNPLAPLYFTFEGGDGILMPMKMERQQCHDK